MKLLNSMVVGVGGGQIAKLQLPAQFQKGFKCSRLRIRANATLTATAAYALQAADVLNVFSFIFGNLTLKFGVTSYELVDDAIPFSIFRLMYVGASLRDFLLQTVTTAVAQQLNQYTTGGPQAIIFSGAGSKTITLEACRSFVWERLSERMHDYCPGYTQMRNLQLEIMTASTQPTIDAGAVTLTGNITYLVIADTVPTDRDVWARVFRTFRNSISGLTQQGPTTGGGLLMCAEMSQPALSTALSDIAIRRGSEDEAIHDIVPAQDVVRLQQSILPLGSFDPNLLATVLYVADDQLDGVEIPTFSYVEFFQPNNDIATPQTAWVHIPTMDSSYVDTTVSTAATGPYGAGSSAILTSEATAAGRKTSTHLQSISPSAILTPESPLYGSLPGRQVSAGAAPTNYIPQAVANAAAAQQASSGGSAAAAATSTANTIAGAIPGHTSPIRGAASTGTLTVAKQLAAVAGKSPMQAASHVAAFHAATPVK